MSTSDLPPTPAEPSTNRTPIGEPISRRRRRIFRLVALSLPLLLLLITEAALWLFGIGKDYALVQSVPGNPPALNYRLNPDADRPYYGGAGLSGPEPRRFDLPKPAKTLRIVVVGASTVIGFPYPPELAFPRQLELFLQSQLPDRQVEVLNAGITSINSFAVKDVLQQSLACEPDLIVIHTGHNEFYGPGGVGSSALQIPPRLLPAAFALRRWRLTQLVGGLFSSDPSAGQDLIESLPRARTILYDGELFRTAEHYYEQNLREMLTTARDAGVPALLTTVASNLRNQGPIGRLAPDSLTAEEAVDWTQLRESAGRSIASEDWESALDDLAADDELFPSHPRIIYEQARCLEGLGRLDEAAEHYRRARDLDPCRFRAPESFREIAQDVAAEFSAPAVRFFDVAAGIDAYSAPHAPGNDLFLEHVHYNLTGHREVARLLAHEICTAHLGRSWNKEALPSEVEYVRQLGLTLFDDPAAYSLALNTVQTPPLSEAAGADRHEEFLIEQIRLQFDALSAIEQSLFADLSMRSMQTDLIRGIQTGYESRGQLEPALRMAEIGVRRQPWSVDRLVALARLQLDAGQSQDAAETLQRIDQLQPDSTAAQVLQRRLEGRPPR